MGLGINIKGEVTNPTSFIAIQEYITNNSSGLFKDFLSFSEDENSLYVRLHPCEETVHFEYIGNHLICSAKTNSVGPGYHAYLVEFIEKLGTDLGVQWHWNLEEGDDYYSDETDYYNHRDFKQLQIEMLEWLRQLAKSVMENGNKNFMLSVPGGYPRPSFDYFAISQLRILHREWFEQIANLEIHELKWAGQEFFIWWNKQDDQHFYKATGTALLNVECPWHYPADDSERKVLNNIDRCFQQAEQLSPKIDLPREDWYTVKNYLNGNDTHIPETEFGYRKHIMTFDLAGNWMIDLPGNLYRSIEDDSEVYYDHDRTVRSRCYTRSDKRSDDEYANDFFDDASAGTEFLESETDIAGKAIVYYSIDKEAEQEYWILQGVKVKEHKFVLSTICYPTEEHKQWAIDTWNSVR
ncbi:hypothetical protein WBG78_29325 [Chryseolinea sp. T2]|uniref:hypothetical protein n=1 Tax=Chryseolinea sp. T2 TaxID=3129255 RepID=UPI00307870F3